MLVINKEDTELNYKITGQLLGEIIDLVTLSIQETSLAELTYRLGYIKGIMYNRKPYDKI